MFRLLRKLAMIFGLIALVWLTGLGVFSFYVVSLDDSANDRQPTTQDAIVVLTGGSERLAAGAALLKRHLGKKLFISGVGHGVERRDLLNGLDLDEATQNCCVTLGYLAGNTSGNAVESVIWLNRQNYRSLHLVTANYHMPRSLLEFRQIAPDLAIVPHPVAPPRVMVSEWWRRPGTARLLATEYNKLLVTALRYYLWRDST